MSFNVSNNEFSGVPVFRPDFDAINPDWQQVVDGCHPLLRTVALAGVSAVQEGIHHSGRFTERLLDVALSDAPLLGDSHKTTSPMFDVLDASDDGPDDFTEAPDGLSLIGHGLRVADLARKLSRIAAVEKEGLHVPVARDSEQDAAPGYATVVAWRRVFDMYADHYFQGGPLKGILAGNDIKSTDIHITDTHAIDPASVAASTTIDVEPRYGYTPEGEGWKPNGLFATIGVEISEDGLVSAKTDNGTQLDKYDGNDPERRPYRLTYFSTLGRYAEYFARFPLR